MRHMKNYFFDNLLWTEDHGICFVVMANNIREAKKTAKRYIEEKTCIWDSKKVLRKRVKINDQAFDVYEFKDEVMEI